jgi:hypothetical protein
MALAETGPVFATVDQADIRGLVTTRLWYVAELLRSRLEHSAHHTTHNVNEDSPCRGRASATAMTILFPLAQRLSSTGDFDCHRDGPHKRY